jgi:hypothetical protein
MTRGARLAFAYRVSITPSDVGARVSLRRRLVSGELSDAVGELASWSDGKLCVVRRDGTVTEIAEDTVVAGKKVPPAPTRVAGRPLASDDAP